METYNKEKLHEYAKELFALCLEKGVQFEYDSESNAIFVQWQIFRCSLEEESFNIKSEENGLIQIWELIEKVKQL